MDLVEIKFRGIGPEECVQESQLRRVKIARWGDFWLWCGYYFSVIIGVP
jgi:hypothetical protein